MALVTVTKNGTSMTVDQANLGIWTGAGWSQQGASAPQAPTATRPSVFSTPTQQTNIAPMPDSATPQGMTRLQVGQFESLDQFQNDYDDIRAVGNPDAGGYWVGYKIPKATVIAPNGQRVVVRTDNRPGKFRTLNEMTNQGFKVEKAPGISADNTIVAPGATNMATRPIIQLASGQRISPQDPNYDVYASQQGAQKVPQSNIASVAGATPNAATTGGDQSGWTDSMKQGYKQSSDALNERLTAQAGWTDSMKQTYEALQSYTNDLRNQGKIVNPKVKLDDSVIGRLMDQAKTEISPFYKQIFEQANTDLSRALKSTAQDLEGRVRNIGQAFGRGTEQAQESFARRGLEFSSDRTREEQRLADEAKTGIEEASRTAEEAAMRAGTATEREVGSANITASRQVVPTGWTPLQGKPGQYGLGAATGSRDLFAPVGGTIGTTERAKEYDVQSRKNELINAEQNIRSAYTM